MDEVSGREVLVSIAIIVVMLIIGSLIGGAIADKQADRNAVIYKAVQIDNDAEAFQYGMRTNVGNALVYGPLTSVGNVTNEFIDGERSYIEVTHERYQMHTREVKKSSGSGENYKEWTETETYWTWDKVGDDEYSCKSYDFLDVNIPEEQVYIHGFNSYEGTFRTGFHKRDVIYSRPTNFTGTMQVNLAEEIVGADYYPNNDIEETVEGLTSNSWVIIWWVIWIFLTAAAVIGFVMLENYWLY